MARWTYLLSRELQTEACTAAPTSTAAIIDLKNNTNFSSFCLERSGQKIICHKNTDVQRQYEHKYHPSY